MEPPQVLVPGLQTVKESDVGTRIHRLANIATVLANLQKERVPHLDKILAEEVSNNYKIPGKVKTIKKTNMLNIIQVEAGHPGSTLALLWAVVSSRKLVSSCTLHMFQFMFQSSA